MCCLPSASNGQFSARFPLTLHTLWWTLISSPKLTKSGLILKDFVQSCHIQLLNFCQSSQDACGEKEGKQLTQLLKEGGRFSYKKRPTHPSCVKDCCDCKPGASGESGGELLWGFSSSTSSVHPKFSRFSLVAKFPSVNQQVIGVDGRMKLVMSNGGWESLSSEQRDALAMVVTMTITITITMTITMTMTMTMTITMKI